MISGPVFMFLTETWLLNKDPIDLNQKGKTWWGSQLTAVWHQSFCVSGAEV